MAIKCVQLECAVVGSIELAFDRALHSGPTLGIIGSLIQASLFDSELRTLAHLVIDEPIASRFHC